jgi:glycosyltransferase involved in cell wall biosynthesis
MKILIMPAKYYPAVGGLESAIQNVASFFKQEGHEVKILTNRYSLQLKSSEKVDGICVKRLFFTDKPPRTKNLWIFAKFLVRLLFIPYTLFKTKQIISKFQPDIIHLHYVGSQTLYLFLIRIFFGFHWNYIVSLHGSDVEFYPVKSNYQQWLLKQSLIDADYLTANSKHLLMEVIQMTRLSPKKMEVVPMAFEPEFYDRKDIEPYNHSKPYLFSAGRLVQKKGFDVLIKAYADLVKTNRYEGDLILAGDGEELKPLKRLSEELNIEKRVIFFGIANRIQMASLMKGCELFIVPSRMEAFGIIVLEGLYSGKRVIASKTGGIPELMIDNPRQLVMPDRPQELAEKITETLKGGCWNSVDKDVLRYHYSWKKVSEAYLRIYRTILNEKEKGRSYIIK